jgi:hypothetical protein
MGNKEEARRFHGFALQKICNYSGR